MTRVRMESLSSEGPDAFMLGDRLFRVREVVDRWDGEDHAFFKVVAEDGITFILRHDLETDQWEITLMDALRD